MSEEVALRVARGDKVKICLTRPDSTTASNMVGGEFNIVLLNKEFENDAMIRVSVEGGGVGDQS